MAFLRLRGFWVVIYHVALSNQWPSHVVPCFDGLETCGFDLIAAYRVHPIDCFLCGWQVVYAINLLEIIIEFLRCLARLPLSARLGQWYAIPAVFILFIDEDRFSLARYEYVLLFVYRDALLGEYRHNATVGCLVNAHQ